MWLILAIILLASLLWWRLHRPGKGSVIPGPRGRPLVGNAFDVPRTKLHLHCSKLAERFGPLFKLNIFGDTVILLNDASLVRKAFAEEPFLALMNDRPSWFAGKYILYEEENINAISYGPLHVKCRKTLHTALHMYGKRIETFEKKIFAELQNLVEKMSADHGGPLSLDQLIQRSLTNVITILLHGEPVLKEEHFTFLNEFDKYVNQLFQPGVDGVLSKFPFLRHLPGRYGDLYRGGCRTRDLLEKVFYYDLKKSYRRDVERGIIDVFLRIQEDSRAEGETWCTDKLLFCLVDSLFTAGIMTSQSTIVSFIFIMLHHSDVQMQIQAEIDDVIGQTGKPSIKHRASMPFTEAAILETLRYISQSPFGLPHICNTDVSFDGYDVPKGSKVFANLWYIHHDKTTWGDPWSFRPQRFLDKDGQLLSADSSLRQKLMPFSIGRRQCPGEAFARARVFLYVTTLLQNFTFLPSEEEPLPACDPRDFKVGVVLMPPEFKYMIVRRTEG